MLSAEARPLLQRAIGVLGGMSKQAAGEGRPREQAPIFTRSEVHAARYLNPLPGDPVIAVREQGRNHWSDIVGLTHAPQRGLSGGVT